MSSMSEASARASTDAAHEVWAPPAVFGRTFGSQGERAERLDRQQRAVLDTIYAKAQADGFAAGQVQFDARIAQCEERIARLDAILQMLSRPLSDLDAEVEKQLVTLSLTVAKHLVRRELRIDPTQVVAIIRNAVALLPAAARDVRVHLHPDDAALVRERLAEPHAERAWTVVEDPIMARGGCRVTTDTSLIDARLDARLGAAISAVLGSERTEVREGPPSDSQSR
jgi:flagellar assembly protein FliH